MTTSSTAVDLSSFTTDAKFRTWGSTVSAALTTVGLTNTTDTGQINWTTVTKPAGVNTVAGYEIWRFNDTLQSTKPIFLKLEYGTGANASNSGTWLTVGTGSNGSGTITGIGMAQQQCSGVGQGATNTTAVGASYSTSAGVLTIITSLLQSSSVSGIWCIARTCDATTGAPDGNGLIVYSHGSPSAPTTAFASYNTSTAYAASAGVPSGSLSAASVASGNVLPLYKNYVIAPTPFPTNAAISYRTGDIAQNSLFTASPFGASHTYWALGSASNTLGIGHRFDQSGNYCGAYLWE